MKSATLPVVALALSLAVGSVFQAPAASAAPGVALPTEAIVITSYAGTGQVVDIRGGSTASGAVVQTYAQNGTSAQSFRLTNCDAAGWCEIRSVKSNKCLDVTSGKTAVGTPVQQYTCNGTKAQRWLVTSVGPNTYTFASGIAADRFLDVRGGTAKSGTPLQIYTGNGTKAQSFGFAPAPDPNALPPAPGPVLAPPSGAVILRSLAGTNQVADIRSGSTASGAVAQTYLQNGTPAQSFVFANCDAAGWCEIRNVKSDKCLDVTSANTLPGTAVQQYTCNGTKAQRWFCYVAGHR